MVKRLTFFYASMNSGKSLSLLTKNHMLRNRGFTTHLMKPAIDTRTDGTIATRLGISEPCSLIEPDQMPSSLVLHSSSLRPDFLLIDEAQFLTKEQVWDLSGLVDNWGISVICYGLRIDWRGEFFTGSAELMKIADELLPLENFCKTEQGQLAYFHIKHGGSDNAVEVGYEDVYDTVSRKTWRSWWTKRELNTSIKM